MADFFEFSLGARVLYKMGLARELGAELGRFKAKRALIVADKGVVAAGLVAPIIANLGTDVEVVGVFDAVPPNSSVKVVEAGAAMAHATGADILLAIGGGSPLDTAKCMRILMKYGGSLLDHQGYNLLEEQLPPMVALPTTAGTGSEVTPFAVIRDEDQDLKLTFASPFLVPDLAILDPELTRNLPPRITAATGIDALSHAIESYVSTDGNPLSDSMALYAIDAIANHLRDATHHGDNMEARGQMLVASCMAGIAFASGFVGMVHALAHSVGGKFAVHHGTAISIILPYGMTFNSTAVPDRYVRIARAMGVNVGGRSDTEVIADGIAAVRNLSTDCGVPQRLRDVGVTEAALDDLAATSLTDAAIFTNPRQATQAELREVLQAAW